MNRILTEYKTQILINILLWINHNRLALEINLGVNGMGTMDKWFHCDPQQLHLAEHPNS